MALVKAALMAAAFLVLLFFGTILFSLRFGLGAIPYGPALATVLREIMLAEAPASAATSPAEPLQEVFPQLASGDVTPTSAVVWARWGQPGQVFIRLWK
jgi:hypothetical protein